jgi:hypothetical protein
MSNNLVDAIQRLIDLLKRENEALKRLDFSSVVALMPLKESALADLVIMPKARAFEPSLAALCQHLNELALENQMQLQRAITVQTRIIRIVARASAPPPTMRYGDHGRRLPSYRVGPIALSTRA